MKRRMTMAVLGALTAIWSLALAPAALAQERTSFSQTTQFNKSTILAIEDQHRRINRPGELTGVTCPEGTFASPFEMPIYDDQGQFVVGYETVWFCLPGDLEPAG